MRKSLIDFNKTGEFRFWFRLGWFSIIHNLIIIALINIIIISRQSTVKFDFLCSGPQSGTRLNKKKTGSIVMGTNKADKADGLGV